MAAHWQLPLVGHHARAHAAAWRCQLAPTALAAGGGAPAAAHQRGSERATTTGWSRRCSSAQGRVDGEAKAWLGPNGGDGGAFSPMVTGGAMGPARKEETA
jgi:hypothetical protein